MAMTPDQIVEAHPHLSLADVHAALAYYYDHRQAIRSEWPEARELIAELQLKYPNRSSGREPKEFSMPFPRITIRGDQMGGVPCIRGLRIPVSVVLDMVADGMTSDEILGLYPDLQVEDIPEALRFAAEAVRERELPLALSS